MLSVAAESIPLVTVIIPSFNHRPYVAEAIASILEQDYPAVELIVIDDGSTDGSVEVIAALAERHGFIFLKNLKNLGVNATLTRAIEAAHGKYIGTLASDDRYLTDKISRQVRYLQEHTLDGVYATGFKIFDNGCEELIDQHVVEQHFLAGTILDHLYITDTDGPLMQSGLFSTAMVRAINPAREHFKSDDHMFIIKALEQYRIGYLPEPVFYYRVHPTNTHRDFWSTLPMRMEIATKLTPEKYRPKFLANIFHSQAIFLFLKGRRWMAFKFLLASIALWPSPSRVVRVFVHAVRGMRKHG